MSAVLSAVSLKAAGILLCISGIFCPESKARQRTARFANRLYMKRGTARFANRSYVKQTSSRFAGRLMVTTDGRQSALSAACVKKKGEMPLREFYWTPDIV